MLLAVALATPMATPSHASAAGSCGTYRSETVPPATIRVFRTATGAVETVDFRTYVKNVLSREWISTWTTESLRSGALAVKNYGWYQVLHWRGYVNEDGKCFDVFDSTRDQHYDPSRPTYASMAGAVDATWSTLAQEGGRIFATYYNAGAPSEPCGANANGWQMFQWGTQACGLAGKTAAQILVTYYAGVVVTAAPPPSPPPPSPTPTPRRRRRAHAGTDGDARPVAGIDARRDAGTPTPTVTPAPTARADGRPRNRRNSWRPAAARPGWCAPPPPPPPNPEPIVVTAAGASGSVTAVARPRRSATKRTHVRSAARHRHPRPGAEPRRHGRWCPIGIGRLSVDAFLELYLGGLLDRWSVALAEEPVGDELGRGDVLDGQPDRLEDRDRVGRASGRPVRADAADLYEAVLRH